MFSVQWYMFTSAGWTILGLRSGSLSCPASFCFSCWFLISLFHLILPTNSPSSCFSVFLWLVPTERINMSLSFSVSFLCISIRALLTLWSSTREKKIIVSYPISVVKLKFGSYILLKASWDISAEWDLVYFITIWCCLLERYLGYYIPDASVP